MSPISSTKGNAFVRRTVNHGVDGVSTSTVTWCASSSGISDESPTTLGNVVRNVAYVAVFCSPAACFSVPAGFSLPDFDASLDFWAGVSVAAGQEIGCTKRPLIASPTMRTFETLSALTCATNAVYGSGTSGVGLGRIQYRFHAVKRARMIQERGLTRLCPGPAG